jgi:hypothetical protein
MASLTQSVCRGGKPEANPRGGEDLKIMRIRSGVGAIRPAIKLEIGGKFLQQFQSTGFGF